MMAYRLLSSSTGKNQFVRTVLRTFLRAFRGVNKNFLWDYVAVYEATFNSKRITPSLVQCLCFGFRGAQINYT